MQCEICGATKGEFHQAIIEGSILLVCTRCSKFGALIQQHPDDQPETIDASKGFHYTESMENIIDDFPAIIKSARAKKKLSQEELANAVAEKISVIQKIESGTLTPPIKTCKKLEQFLQVKLIIQQQTRQIKYEQPKTKVDLKSQKLTIGDLLKLKFNADKK